MAKMTVLAHGFYKSNDNRTFQIGHCADLACIACGRRGWHNTHTHTHTHTYTLTVSVVWGESGLYYIGSDELHSLMCLCYQL